MSTLKTVLGSAVLVGLLSSAAFAQAINDRYGFGTKVDPAELSGFFAIPPDGRGLPPGSGTGTQGAKVFAENCAACHGDKLEGNPAKGIGGDKLIGGRGSLATKTPVKTVESYWPYATTLFDYVKRAMPFSAPGSLKNDEVYAVVAYILSEGKIIKPTDTVNAETLPKIAMPNKDGFVPDPRPELQLYH
ncbi:MAG: cytochrome c [Afipia sp.]|nr:cytochrome c [Afipia sp.]OJW65998.1 MAG: cytochrome C [Afipia sp. 64-13]